MDNLSSCYCELGESPVWNATRGCYHWVDITKAKVFTFTVTSELLEEIELSDKVGCIALNNNGDLIAALSREIIKISLEDKSVQTLLKANISSDEMFNDGKVDAKGRFWLATKDLKEQEPNAKLYCFDGQTLELKDEGFIVGNGIDWTLDNKAMYFTDSPRKVIYRYDFDLVNAKLGKRELFAKIDRGFPDGLTVDAFDNVWSAHWDGSCLTCYDFNGHVKETLELESKRPTSCCFGGEAFDKLFVTSAYIGLEKKGPKDGLCQAFDNLSTGRAPNLASF